MKHLIKDLDWQFCDYLYEVVYRVETDLYHYAVSQDKKRGTVEVDYYKEDMMQPSKTATGFKTLDQGKEWAFNHHCEKLSKWLNPDPLTETVNWFKEAKPEPTKKDICVQIGCHYEEVSEFDSAISNNCEDNAYNSEYYKRTKDCEAAKLKLKPGKVNSVEVLDSLADQIVTAVGVAYMMGFDIIGALKEVNASNWSKFENGKAVTDENGKIIKGEGYFKPQLEKYLGGSND